MMTDIGQHDLDTALDHIRTYEEGFRPTPATRFLRWAGKTRVFAAVYGRIGPSLDVRLTRITHGRTARLYGITALLLTTRGARTGRPRTVPLLYVRHGRQFAVIGSNFGRTHHPAWTANLLARPEATIEVGPERLNVVAALADGSTREELRSKFVAMYPGVDAYAGWSAPREARIFLLNPV